MINIATEMIRESEGNFGISDSLVSVLTLLGAGSGWLLESASLLGGFVFFFLRAIGMLVLPGDRCNRALRDAQRTRWIVVHDLSLEQTKRLAGSDL